MKTIETPWGAWCIVEDERMRGCGVALDCEVVVLASMGSPERTRAAALVAIEAFVNAVARRSVIEAQPPTMIAS